MRALQTDPDIRAEAEKPSGPRAVPRGTPQLMIVDGSAGLAREHGSHRLSEGTSVPA